MKGRLFTFGCSFTSYHWPTWADILGTQYEYFENWGCCGAGNQYIFNSIMECDLRNNFAKDDTVMVMWSGVPREDRYINKIWQTPGNIFTQGYYDKDFVKKYADIRGYLIRDLATIYAVTEFFKSRNCKFIMMAMAPMQLWHQSNADETCVDDVSDILPYYAPILSKILPSVLEVVFNMDWQSRTWYYIDKIKLNTVKEHYDSCAGPSWPSFERFINKDFHGVDQNIVNEIHDLNKWDWNKVLGYARKDNHPTPMEHLMYVTHHFPHIEIDHNTKTLIESIDKRILASTLFTDLWSPVIIKRW